MFDFCSIVFVVVVAVVVVGVVPAALLILGRGRGRAAGAAEDHFRLSKSLFGARSSACFCSFVIGAFRVCRTFSDMVAMREGSESLLQRVSKNRKS